MLPFPEQTAARLNSLRHSLVRRVLRSAGSDDQGRIIIGPRKIYILPTRFGLMYAVLVLSMLAGSINYANNLGYLLTFFLASIGVLAMHHTWLNLLNLELTFLPVQPVHAGQHCRIELDIYNSHQRQRGAIQFYAESSESYRVEDIAINQHKRLVISYPTKHRGWLQLADLVLATQYPLGLLHAWVRLDPGIQVLVYPKPSKQADISRSLVYSHSSEGSRGQGADDFVSHRNYRLTDSPRQIDWKIYAREKGLMTKQFGGDRSEKLWLRLDQVKGNNLEERLSILTRAVLDAYDDHVEYALDLPGQSIPLNHGFVHKQACLKALALYALEQNDE